MSAWSTILHWLMLRPPVDRFAAPALAALFVLCFWQEIRRPLRRFVQSEAHRLFVNGIVAIPGLIVARGLLVPATAWMAWFAGRHYFGLVRWLPLPPLAQGTIGFLLMDYAIYIWHRMNHRAAFLWRFHNVHHTDLDLTASTAFRFHFVEMITSTLFRCAAVALIGLSPLLALVYEFTLDGANTFVHSNWRLPLFLERVLNLALVTPRMHGIHHSMVERETNSNWSTIFSWWDRLHGTLRLDIPQDQIIIGVPAYCDPGELTIFALLALPFRPQRDYWLNASGERPERPVTPRDRIIPVDSGTDRNSPE